MSVRIISIKIYALLHNIVKAAKIIVVREIHTTHLKIHIIKIKQLHSILEITANLII